MIFYKNPVLSGFYPDPSVCEYEGTYYLVTSSFQYNPGVPLFESKDLVNWKQIGHVLTRESQVNLAGVRSSGGIFAPTIRVHDGRFYMVTNNNSADKNFYVYTDDIHGEWSDPVFVDQSGIDPSLFWDEDGKCYFQSNYLDTSSHKTAIYQCEIDIENGMKLSESKAIWGGSGGRYLESPHVYKINDYYYLMAAEGGTEYGHMITYARSKNVWGPYEDYPNNPVLTNRNKAPFSIQGIGHGDLVTMQGELFIVCLGFREIDKWQPYHHLGREVFLIPAEMHEDGWFTAGDDGTADLRYAVDVEDAGEDTFHNISAQKLYNFQNTSSGMEWVFLRDYKKENYDLNSDRFILRGSDITLDDVGSPTFVAMRQKEFIMDTEVIVDVKDLEIESELDAIKKNRNIYQANTMKEQTNSEEANSSEGLDNSEEANSSEEYNNLEEQSNIIDFSSARQKLLKDKNEDGTEYYIHVQEKEVTDEAGITLYMDEKHHYDLTARKVYRTYNGKYTLCDYVLLRFTNGDVTSGITAFYRPAGERKIKLKVHANNLSYYFEVHTLDENGKTVAVHSLGKASTKYLSSEVAGGFTGVMIGLFATGKVEATFTDFKTTY